MTLRLNSPLLCRLALSVGLGACSLSGPLREDSKAAGYTFRAPNASTWQALKEKADADMAWSQRKNGATLALNSVCNRYEHISVQALSRNLLNIVQEPEVETQDTMTLAGREAATTVFRGKVDGVTIQNRLVVMRKDNCIFDFTLSQLGQITPDVMTDFDAFLSSFKYEGGVAK